MDTHKYLKEMRNIQEKLLTYIEDESNDEKNYCELNNNFDEIKIREDQHRLMSFLHLLTKISNNHHRGSNFFIKIDRILQNFQDDMKKYYSNSEIFNIFKSNKRILLFLIEQRILIIDEYFVKTITNGKYINAKYPQYFSPEIKPFLNEKWFPKSDPDYNQNKWIEEINKELPDNFYENRKIGENDRFICKLIQKDSVEEFITYVNKTNYSLNSEIYSSIFETNYLLIKLQKDPERIILLCLALIITITI